MKGILESKNLSEFMWEEAAKGQLHDFKINKPSSLDKEQILNCINDLSSDVDEYFQYSIAIIHQIITSTVNLIPAELNEEEKRIAKHCLDYSDLLSTQLIPYKNTIHRILSDDVKNEKLNDSTKLKTLKAQRASIVLIFNEVNYVILIAIWFRQHVYEYYYGPKENKAKNEALLVELYTLVKQSLNEIKENQKETNKLIESRNEAEKPKRLQVAKCAKDICRILKNEYTIVVKQDTIEKYLHRFDDDLEMGKKIALPSYEHAMYFDKSHFIVWIREQFIPHYLEHRKIRVKNKTPRRSSSDAAFDEAARQKYKDEEEGDDNF